MRELLEALTLRVRSPIFGYFVLAFTAANWKPLFYLIISSQDPIVRIKYFEQHSSLNTTLYEPLLFALFFGLIYPWLHLAFLKAVQIPTRLRNEINAENEHAHLLRKLELEKLRGDFLAEKERQLIERTKRDNEVEELSDPDLKQNLKNELNKLRQEKYQGKDIDLLEATKLALDALGIDVDKTVTTGGSTGIRIWLSKEVSKNALNTLHEEIVSFHGKPIALDVREYKSDQVVYSSERPNFLKKE